MLLLIIIKMYTTINTLGNSYRLIPFISIASYIKNIKIETLEPKLKI